MARIVFIDTNTYLSFYRMSDNDVKEMHKMIHAMNARELTVVLNSQVEDEYWRNRESVIDEALKAFKKERAPRSFPRMVMGYDNFQKTREVCAQLDALLAELAGRVDEDAAELKLEADKLIVQVFENAERVDVDTALLEAAKARFDRGNPPGKMNGRSPSYGDAIHWECLLRAANPDDDLFIVSGDRDWASPLRPGISEFLTREWSEAHRGELRLFETLGQLFKDYYPNIEVQIEFELQRVVEELQTSKNFATTHDVISRLDPAAPYTRQQVQGLLQAAMENNQVYAIGGDQDVEEFFGEFLGRNCSDIPGDSDAHLREYFNWIRP